ncbi:MAG: 2-dehydropantoate 2-reductase [Desulfurococcaceae archaeon]
MNAEICIVGGGAIGSTIAYYIYRSGVSLIPIYYGSVESVDKIHEQGGVIILDKVKKEEFLVPVIPRLYNTPIDQCEYVFNTVKAYQVPSTLSLMKKITSPSGLIIMLQNGFGSLELVESEIPNSKIGCGVVYIGAERVGKGRVIYYGGNTVIASCRKQPCIELMLLSSKLRIGGLDFRLTDDIDYYRWLKLALNAVVNPITAILRTRNKILLEREGLDLARLILKEVKKAAEKFGYVFDEDRLLAYVKRNIELVLDNISSMAQDIIRGEKTEIDYINGYIARILGEEAIVNKALTILVKLAEKTYA